MRLQARACGILLAGLLAVEEGSALPDFKGLNDVCPSGEQVPAVLLHKPTPHTRLTRSPCSWTGSPIIKFTVGRDGTVASPEVLRRSGCAIVDSAILRCLSEWRYAPATCNGEPVAVDAFVQLHLHYGPFLEDVLDEICPPYQPPEDEQQWGELLSSALDRTPEARALLVRTAERRVTDRLGKLARVLLEEWDLEPTSETLQQPRAVDTPQPDFSNLVGEPVRRGVVVVAGEVTQIGTLEKVRVETGVGNEIDRRCLEAVGGARFRPARGKHGYVRGEAVVTCHVSVP